jgi:tRNA pseudouridine38-40 synthase
VLEYDGGAYSGWQRQGPAQESSGRPSLQGRLEAALAALTGEGVDELAVRVAGRTDAGVHARAQVCAHLGT